MGSFGVIQNNLKTCGSARLSVVLRIKYNQNFLCYIIEAFWKLLRLRNLAGREIYLGLIFDPGIFLEFGFCPQSIIPVTLNTDYPPPPTTTTHLLTKPFFFVAFIPVVDARVR